MPTKRIVCLANSRKNSGRCVAGRVLDGAQALEWVRPVSARPSEEVSEYERQYPDGGDPRVLDLIDVPLLEPRPKQYQIENWLLDPEQSWQRAGQATWVQVVGMAQDPKTLWINGGSTYHGLNDQIAQDTANTLTDSLYLVHVPDIRLRVFRPNANFGDPRLRVQGQFEHRGQAYWLRVTDPAYERTYQARGEGEYPLGECCLTISLGEPFQGNCYKLIAAIIPKP